MTTKNILISLLLSTTILVCPNCARNTTSRSSQNELWKGQYSLEIKEVLRIGSEDLEDDRYVFSGINDIQFDNLDNVYVLDRKEFRIQVYSPLGIYIKSIPLKKGQGPGEFLRAFMFDIDSANHIYIVDDFLRRVTAIDERGKLIDIMTVRTELGTFVASEDNVLFLTEGGVSSDGYEIHKYHFPDGQLLGAFCKGNRESDTMKRVGGIGEICLDPFGQIYYSFCAPNDIRKFTQQGELLGEFSRLIAAFKPPKRNELGLPYMPVTTKAICSFPDGKVLHVFFDQSSKPYVDYFDIFDNNGNWLLSFNTTHFLTDWFGRLVRVDNEGHIYVESWRPFPHVRKYSLRLTKNHD